MHCKTLYEKCISHVSSSATQECIVFILHIYLFGIQYICDRSSYTHKIKILFVKILFVFESNKIRNNEELLELGTSIGTLDLRTIVIRKY